MSLVIVDNDGRTTTTTMVSFDIAGTLKQKVGVALTSSPPKGDLTSRDPNGSCLFVAGSPSDTVDSHNFQTFSTLIFREHRLQWRTTVVIKLNPDVLKRLPQTLQKNVF